MLIKDAQKTGLSRRAMLRGAAGVAVALPFLDAMTQTASAQAGTATKRYVVMFAGVSTGRDGGGTVLTPSALGRDYTLTRPLQGLGTQGVKNDVALVTNLTIGLSGAGARGRPWHSSSLGPLLSGRSAVNSEDRFSALGPTSDQVAIDAVGGAQRFRSLEYKVQASGYRDETSFKRIMSYRAGSGANEPITSTRVAYESLFTGFVPNDPVAEERARRELAKRRSVVDLVKGNATTLRGRLGRADNQRLDRHFDELRDLEERLNTIEPDVESACRQLDRVGGYNADPAIENTRDEELCRSFSANSPECNERVIGFAQESERARLMADLVHMAFVCDLTRVATVMLTHAQSFMNVSRIVASGVVTDAHELGHGTGSRDDHSDMVNWHVDNWAYLVRKLKDTADVSGTMLDHTALALVFEGGFGFDPEGNSNNVTHSSENMAVLLAGAGIAPGHHNGNGAHPAQGLLTALRAVGHTGALGDFTTPISLS